MWAVLEGWCRSWAGTGRRMGGSWGLCPGLDVLKPWNLSLLFPATPQLALCLVTVLEGFVPALPRELQPNQQPRSTWDRGGFATLNLLWREQRPLHAGCPKPPLPKATSAPTPPCRDSVSPAPSRHPARPSTAGLSFVCFEHFITLRRFKTSK